MGLTANSRRACNGRNGTAALRLDLTTPFGTGMQRLLALENTFSTSFRPHTKVFKESEVLLCCGHTKSGALYSREFTRLIYLWFIRVIRFILDI